MRSNVTFFGCVGGGGVVQEKFTMSIELKSTKINNTSTDFAVHVE